MWRAGQTVNLGELVYAGSAFLGVDTPIGPLYLAHGHAEGGFDDEFVSALTMRVQPELTISRRTIVEPFAAFTDYLI